MVIVSRLRRLMRDITRRLSEVVLGPRFEDLVNPGMKYLSGEWHSNERLIEYPFVHRELARIEGETFRILDFGCTESLLPIELAVVGHQVVGVDLRPYPFRHPAFEFVQRDILSGQFASPFDIVTCVSTLEHVGLEAYGGDPSDEALTSVQSRLAEILNPNGRLLLTAPVGQAHTDSFQRSFAVQELERGFEAVGLKLEREQLYMRRKHGYWRPADRTEIKGVSNRPEDRGPTGANGVGCFTFVKSG